MKKLVSLLVPIFILLLIFTYPEETVTLSTTSQEGALRYPTKKLITENEPFIEAMQMNQLERKLTGLSYDTLSLPKEWGLAVSGVKRKLKTTDPVIALTFDACGSSSGNGFDAELIDFLVENEVPATLFINERWIHANPDEFNMLAKTDIFQIENHGTHHKPLSVDGKSAYGIGGTASVQEAIDEVMSNYYTIYKLTEKQATYFRSGTAHYDEVAVSLLNELGIEVVNFDINGDAGATYSAEKVTQSLLQSQTGSIAILHMNQPQSGTAEGVAMAVPLLREQGFRFVKLEDYELE